jgi:hypothetical protein
LVQAVAAVLCVHTLGRPSLFCKLTETERESIKRAAAAAERALLNVQRHGGLQPTAGRQGSHNPMEVSESFKCRGIGSIYQ